MRSSARDLRFINKSLKPVIFLTCCLALSLSSHAQSPSWVMKVDPAVDWQGVSCDDEGHLYHYGCAPYVSRPGWGSGGVAPFNMQKITPEGELIYDLKLSLPMQVRKMIHDGSQYFYFTGSVTGDFVVNSVQYKTKGPKDGAVGKMDENGNILWLKTFGGNQEDNGMDITFNADRSGLIVTGDVLENFNYDGQSFSSCDHSLLLAAINPDGQLGEYRLMDFVSGENGRNAGLEIVTAGNGDYFLLARREGKDWNVAMPEEPQAGTYVFRLSPSFETIWSKLILSGSCYYGYVCKGLTAFGNDVFVGSYCASKYGGTGRLLWMNGHNGTEKWGRPNDDGQYHAALTHGDRLCFIATEGANIYPGEGCDFGYEVLREMDAGLNEKLHVLVRKGIMNYFAVNRHGTIFCSGTAGDTVQVGDMFVPKAGDFIFALRTSLKLSVAEAAAPDEIQVYPNPVDISSREIQVISQLPVLEARLYDIAGREMKISLIPGESGSYRVILPSAGTGIYLLRLETPQGRTNRKIVIE
jgi:hypothetical protein